MGEKIRFLIIVIIAFISQMSLITNGEMIFDYPKPELYQKHLLLILEKYLDPGKVNFCIDCDELIHLISRKVALVTISRKDKIVNWPAYKKVDSYIMDLTKTTKKKLEYLEKMPGWNPRAKFFIVYRKKCTNYLLKALFSKYIVNVAILLNPDNTTLTIQTYDPFKNGKLHPKTLKAITIGSITETNREIDLQIDFFPNKYPRKWNNITINVTPVYSPPYTMQSYDIPTKGLDLLNLNSVAERIGVTINYSRYVRYWGDKGKNGKYNFAFGNLQARKFDIGVGAFPLSYPECVDFDMAYPVMEDYLVIAVPSALVKQRWKCIVDIFTKPVWLWFLLCILFITIELYIISIHKTKHDVSTSFLICLGCFLKVCVPRMPKSKSQRFLLMFWIVFCFLVDIYFESHLLGAFNKVQREKQIDTFEEIKEMGMKVAINKKYLQLFTHQRTEVDRFIVRNHYKTNFPLKALNDSIKYKKNAVVGLERFMKFNTAMFYVNSKDSSPRVHIVKKKLMFYPLTVYFTKGFPLFDCIQKLLHDYRVVGCIQKLYRYGEHIDQMLYHKYGTTWKMNALSLGEFKYIFGMLFSGLGISCLILFFEILWHKFN